MERLPSELEAASALRDLGNRSRAEAILASPSRVRPALIAAAAVGASLLAQFALDDANEPLITRALLVAMLAGLVVASIELWDVRRRLEAVIQLLQLKTHDQA